MSCTEYAATATDFPFRDNSPMGTAVTRSEVASSTDWLMSISPAGAFDSNREAVFTVSPMAV